MGMAAMKTVLQVAPNIHLGHVGRKAFLSIPSFSLPGPGTYTLEGPNGSGKSMFIRLLTATLPGGVDPTMAPGVQVDENPLILLSYRDALDAGIVAVFQDDDMISPMTVFENLLLRHGNSEWVELRNYLWRTSYNRILAPTCHALEVLGPALPAWTEKLLQLAHPPSADWRAHRALRRKALELLKTHGVAANILDEVPPRLSGGGRAAARLVAAQLYKNARVLLLDEPFNSVEKNIWPTFLDSIKTWAQEKDTAVLAISHNPAELIRWEPRVRFEIRNGVLAEVETFAFGRKRRVAQVLRNSIPIFEHLGIDANQRAAVWKSLWIRLKPTRCVVVVDSSAGASQFVADLNLHLPGGCSYKTVHIQGSDLESILDSVQPLSNNFSDVELDGRTVVVIVGGSRARSLGILSALNAASFNPVSTVIALTSFQNAIEAVVSSRLEITSVGASRTAQSVIVNANFYPDAFVGDFGLLSESTDDRQNGLISSLRIGLVLDAELFRECERLLGVLTVGPDILLEIFHRVLSAINETVDVDDNTGCFGQALRFGNLHAQCILEIADHKIRPTEALLLGMIIEARLGGSKSVIERLEELRRRMGLKFPANFVDPSRWEAVREVYIRRGVTTTIRSIRLDLPGEFNVTGIRRELMAKDPDASGLYNRDVNAFACARVTAAIQNAGWLELRGVLIQLI